ncbi:uncharacterized protein B0P05DRAFT_579494 [Gilbertella persicaria]|uniref:uncharacterized protein n=1 Tax=Gilbertella persicaria TaxID=101096 RepID=UPI00221F3B61|nr:uncharacterized protein B0P05DRAFT_579494 [Gilbertella persicaria]KAI8078232.1 hypothetical protein B0P05DRAFT_579494 [Gilbertella persicaria]
MRRPNKFNTDAILKMLTDYPGHFVIGILGKQGVGHKTDGIDMYVTPERAILLDTEPVLSWTVLDKVLRSGSLGGLHPDLWLEMENLYNIIFMMSVCNIVLVVSDGPELDMDLLRLLQRAVMLKFNLPDFPLLTGQQDMHYYPDMVFVCNKCQKQEFTFKKYSHVDRILTECFEGSQLKTQGLVGLSDVLPLFKSSQHHANAFFLPDWSEKTQVESFDTLISALRDQVFAAPRRAGKKGQVSEKDWYRNAIKTFELVRKSDYISDYLQVVRKLRDA